MSRLGEARYIAVEGAIGAGKSTLARLLAERTRARLVVEPDQDNPFLERFYADPKAHAFQTQLFYLLSRYQQQASLSQGDLFERGIVCDYLFAKDRIFAALTLDEQEFRLYDRIYSLLDAQLPRPDLVVFLHAKAEVLLERIRKRGRASEGKIRPAYLEELAQAYNQFFFHWSETPLLVVAANEIDFVDNEADQQALLKEIERTRTGIHHFIPLSASQTKLDFEKKGRR